MLVTITKDYTYTVDKVAKRTLFSGIVYDEDAALVADIVEAGHGKSEEYGKLLKEVDAKAKKDAEAKAKKEAEEKAKKEAEDKAKAEAEAKKAAAQQSDKSAKDGQSSATGSDQLPGT